MGSCLLFPESSRPTVTINMTVLVDRATKAMGRRAWLICSSTWYSRARRLLPTCPRRSETTASFNAPPMRSHQLLRTLRPTDGNLEFGIHLEADRLSIASSSDRSCFGNDGVRNEFESGENSPVRILSSRACHAYEWHQLRQIPIGNRSDIERVPIENLQASTKSFYQPDNVVLIVPASVEEDEALAFVQKNTWVQFRSPPASWTITPTRRSPPRR